MNQEQVYKIGAVSKLVGIPAVTLRMWERRHAVVEPARTDAGGRLYSQADLQRLALVKQAVDAGHSISTVAALDSEAIRQRLRQSVNSSPAGVDGPIACYVVGRPGFLAQNDAAGTKRADTQQFVELGRFDTIAALIAATADDDRTVDTLIVEVDLVTPELLRQLKRAQQQTSCSGTVVVYKFGTRAHLGMIKQSRARLLQAPVQIDAVLAMARDLLQRLPTMAPPQADNLDQMIFAPIPDRRYSDDDLAQLAQASSAVKCECPEHLAGLIERLAAFEDYSAHCENENREDAAIHMMLHGVAAHARRSLEDALQRVVEFEQIELPRDA